MRCEIKEGFDSRLRARSWPALTLHWSVIHSRPFKSLQTKKPEEKSSGLAEKEGFEPSRQLSHPTPLAGEPLRPLGYFSTAYKDMESGGERGIRTPGALRLHWFSRPAPSTTRPSLLEPAFVIIPDPEAIVNRNLFLSCENPHFNRNASPRACPSSPGTFPTGRSAGILHRRRWRGWDSGGLD